MTNRGVVKTAPGVLKVQDIAIPALRDDYILVQVKAVALNPADWQSRDEPFRAGVTGPLLEGIDFAGIVVTIGANVTKTFKPGDKIAGVAHGCNDLVPDDGAFAHFITVRGDVAIRVPNEMGFEEAATLSTGFATVGLGFFLYLNMDIAGLQKEIPSKVKEEREWIFVYGGSSATGSIAVQLAKLAGYRVVTTSSQQHVSWLHNLGADVVLDYHNPTVGCQIRTLTNNTLTKVFDTIAVPSSASICADAFSSSSFQPLSYVNLMGIECPREDVESTFFLGYSILGKSFYSDGEYYPVVERAFEFGVKFIALVDNLLASGRVRSHPAVKKGEGWDAVIAGVEELKVKGVSGGKLVYTIGDGE